MVRAQLQNLDSGEKDGGRAPVDLVHLARHTLGNRALEQEVLRLFLRQSELVLKRMEMAEQTKSFGEQAHTIKGSARGIGAWKVAMAAESLELEAAAGRRGSLMALKAAVGEANGFIAGLLEN